MKLGDVQIGQKFIHNNKIYLRIDMELSTMFANGNPYDGTICALDMGTFKVMCFSKKTEII